MKVTRQTIIWGVAILLVIIAAFMVARNIQNHYSMEGFTTSMPADSNCPSMKKYALHAFYKAINDDTTIDAQKKTDILGKTRNMIDTSDLSGLNLCVVATKIGIAESNNGLLEKLKAVKDTDVMPPTVAAAAPTAAAPTAAPVTTKDLETLRKQLKEDILATLKFEAPTPVSTKNNATPSVQQGKQYCGDPDYISKDSIPCWGCKL
jgi:hypothetical protein